MNDTAGDGPGADPIATVQARLAALRSQGAWRIDPMRFIFMEGVSRRLDGQPPAVRRLLEARLDAALAEYIARTAGTGQGTTRPGAAKPALPAPRPAGTPLSQLNRYIRDTSLAVRDEAASTLGEAPLPDELASARRFQRAWASRRSQAQVAQAAARRPANAGPLNSHGLVLQSLALMEELSPEYLQRFLLHVETLQWLAAAGDKAVDGKARPAGAARRSRSRRQATPPG